MKGFAGAEVDFPGRLPYIGSSGQGSNRVDVCSFVLYVDRYSYRGNPGSEAAVGNPFPRLWSEGFIYVSFSIVFF